MRRKVVSRDRARAHEWISLLRSDRHRDDTTFRRHNSSACRFEYTNVSTFYTMFECIYIFRIHIGRLLLLAWQPREISRAPPCLSQHRARIASHNTNQMLLVADGRAFCVINNKIAPRGCCCVLLRLCQHEHGGTRALLWYLSTYMNRGCCYICAHIFEWLVPRVCAARLFRKWVCEKSRAIVSEPSVQGARCSRCFLRATAYNSVSLLINVFLSILKIILILFWVENVLSMIKQLWDCLLDHCFQYIPHGKVN